MHIIYRLYAKSNPIKINTISTKDMLSNLKHFPMPSLECFDKSNISFVRALKVDQFDHKIRFRYAMTANLLLLPITPDYFARNTTKKLQQTESCKCSNWKVINTLRLVTLFGILLFSLSQSRIRTTSQIAWTKSRLFFVTIKINSLSDYSASMKRVNLFVSTVVEYW